MRNVLLLFCLVSFSALADDLGELSRLKSNYQTELAAATKPVEVKYVDSLKRLKSLAAFRGNQTLVAAIDKELSLSSVDGLAARLENTTWVWNGSETITFLAGQRGRWSYDNKNSFTWRVSQNDKNMIEGKGPRNQSYTIILNPDTRTGVVKEAGQGDRATRQLAPK